MSLWAVERLVPLLTLHLQEIRGICIDPAELGFAALKGIADFLRQTPILESVTFRLGRLQNYYPDARFVWWSEAEERADIARDLQVRAQMARTTVEYLLQALSENANELLTLRYFSSGDYKVDPEIVKKFVQRFETTLWGFEMGGCTTVCLRTPHGVVSFKVPSSEGLQPLILDWGLSKDWTGIDIEDLNDVHSFETVLCQMLADPERRIEWISLSRFYRPRDWGDDESHVTELVAAVARSSTVRSLSLRGLSIYPLTIDFRNMTLKSLDFIDCCFWGDAHRTLDPFRGLEELRLTRTHVGAFINNDAETGSFSLASILANNVLSLVSLDLLKHNAPDPAYFTPWLDTLPDFLREGTRLESFRFHSAFVRDNNLHSNVLGAILSRTSWKCLFVNLYNHHDDATDPPFAIEFLRGLSACKGLKFLGFNEKVRGAETATALLETIQELPLLSKLKWEERIDVFYTRPDNALDGETVKQFENQFDFHVWLNTVGRRLIRESVSLGIWPQVLARISGDPSLLMYILVHVPCLTERNGPGSHGGTKCRRPARPRERKKV